MSNNEFEIKLGQVTYKSTSTHSSMKDADCSIRAQINGFDVHIRIPIEEKITRTKALIFVEAFHEAITKAVADQKLGDLQYGKRNI